MRKEYITLVAGWSRLVNWLAIRRNDMVVFRFDWTPNMNIDVLRTNSWMIDHFHAGTTPDPHDIHNWVWELCRIKLTPDSAKKAKPLYIPSNVAYEVWKHKPESIVVRYNNFTYKRWKLIWGVARRECKVGKGWYEFKKNSKVKAGDVVKFEKRGVEM